MKLNNSLIITIVLIIISICILIFIEFRKKKVKESFTNYKKCDKYAIGDIIGNIFESNSISKTKSNNWDIYLPCGYNNVEKELKTITPNNSKQIIFGISGCDMLVSKNGIWILLLERYGRERAKEIMPESYLINNKSEMKIFMKNYIPGRTYILKKNIQRKKGLLLTNNINDILYSRNEKYKIVQEYISNVYTINKRKLNLRLYVIVICKNKNITAYVHNYGKCIYTNKDYNENNTDFESNITSYNLNQSIYETNPLTLSELRSYMKGQGDDYHSLMTKIYSSLSLVISSADKTLGQISNLNNNITFQLFGVDVVFTKNLKPYILEFNKGPDMVPKSNRDRELKTKIEEDMFSLTGVIPKNKNNLFIKIF